MLSNAKFYRLWLTQEQKRTNKDPSNQIDGWNPWYTKVHKRQYITLKKLHLTNWMEFFYLWRLKYCLERRPNIKPFLWNFFYETFSSDVLSSNIATCWPCTLQQRYCKGIIFEVSKWHPGTLAIDVLLGVIDTMEIIKLHTTVLFNVYAKDNPTGHVAAHAFPLPQRLSLTGVMGPSQTSYNWDFADEGLWEILGSPHGDRTQDLQYTRWASYPLDYPAASWLQRDQSYSCNPWAILLLDQIRANN